ncbi:hypothetical protein [Nonomuraea dietziae]|uniref:hypothetical protein n=1 Tax=Nonomuraea dietziae TaxID=65515 RepID=UPI0033ED29F1
MGNKFIALVQPGGTTLIRDPRTTPRWNSVSTVAGYPPDVVAVSLASEGTTIHVTVNTATGGVFQSACMVTPTPGTGGNPAWPGNCTPFGNFTPPL